MTSFSSGLWVICSGMVNRYDYNLLVTGCSCKKYLSVNTADGFMRNPEEGKNLFRGKPAHGNNYFRQEKLDLTVKISCTGRNFISLGNPVFRGPAFDDARDEDPAPFKADRSEKIFMASDQAAIMDAMAR